MKTVDYFTGGVHRTRNEAFDNPGRINGIKITPCKESARRYEQLLRSYHRGFREDYPDLENSSDYPLTPFQQWLIVITWQHCKGFRSKTHKKQTIDWIIQHRDTYSKESYEQRTILPNAATNGIAIAQR